MIQLERLKLIRDHQKKDVTYVVEVVDVNEREEQLFVVEEFSLKRDAGVKSVCFSAGPTHVAAVATGAVVEIFNIQATAAVGAGTREPLATCTGHKGRVQHVAFVHQGESHSLLVSCSMEDGTARVWQKSSGKLDQTLPCHTLMESSASSSPDGKLIATGACDGVRIWSLVTGKLARTLPNSAGAYVNAVAFSACGTKLASAGEGRTVSVWDVKTGHLDLELTDFTAPVECVAFDGVARIAAGSGKSFKVFDLGQPEKSPSFIGYHAQPVSCLAFSPCGSMLVSGAGRSVKIWTLSSDGSNSVNCDLAVHTDSVACVAFSDDGQKVVSGWADGTVKLVSVHRGSLKKVFQGSGSLQRAHDWAIAFTFLSIVKKQRQQLGPSDHQVTAGQELRSLSPSIAKKIAKYIINR